jgi:hypothetical protein
MAEMHACFHLSQRGQAARDDAVLMNYSPG